MLPGKYNTNNKKRGNLRRAGLENQSIQKQTRIEGAVVLELVYNAPILQNK